MRSSLTAVCLAALACGRAGEDRQPEIERATPDSAAPAHPDTAGWATFRSERWGISMRHPAGTTIVVEGPQTSGCDNPAAVTATSQEGTTGSSNRVRLAFSPLPFEPVAQMMGFRRIEGGWVGPRDDQSRPRRERLLGNVVVLSGRLNQRIYGSGESTLQPSDMTLGMFPWATGCAVVLLGESTGDGAGLPWESVFATASRR